MTEESRINRIATDAIWESRRLLVRRPLVADQDAHAVAEGGACWGGSVSRGAIALVLGAEEGRGIETG